MLGLFNKCLMPGALNAYVACLTALVAATKLAKAPPKE